MLYAKRRDKTERGIVWALRKAGAAVQRLDGPGIPDLLVSYDGVLHLVEVKNANARGGSKYNTGDGELTSTQTRWWASWQDSGGKAPVIVHNTLEALEALGIPLNKLANRQRSNVAASSGKE